MGGIVVGVDESASSQAALRWAVAEARLRGSGLVVVSAWEFPFAGPASSGGDDLLPTVPSLQESALAELDATVAAAGGDPKSPDVTTRLIHGSPARVLLDAAKDADADLVVVGSRGRGGFSGLVLGSVGRQVIQHAPCPVVVVREPGTGSGTESDDLA